MIVAPVSVNTGGNAGYRIRAKVQVPAVALVAALLVDQAARQSRRANRQVGHLWADRGITRPVAARASRELARRRAGGADSSYFAASRMKLTGFTR